MVYIYVLKLEQEKYYIGKTNNPQFRLDNHFTSNGSEWTKIYKPVFLLELRPNCDDYDEDKVTRQYMDNYGIESDDPNQDSRWSHNIFATDTVFFECGRMASALDGPSGGDNEHTHDADEVEICKEIANQTSKLLQGTYTDRGDEGDHSWEPFC